MDWRMWCSCISMTVGVFYVILGWTEPRTCRLRMGCSAQARILRMPGGRTAVTVRTGIPTDFLNDGTGLIMKSPDWRPDAGQSPRKETSVSLDTSN